MLDIFNNKMAFLAKQPKREYIFIVFFTIIFSIIIGYTYNKKIYDTYLTKGIVSCTTEVCTIKTAVPTNVDFKQVFLNNESLAYEIISKELLVDEQNYITYYEIVLETTLTLTDNEIVDLSFYYNKQRIITKIKDKMF